MTDREVGEVWKTCFDADRDDMVDRPFTIKQLIRKLVDERARYKAAHYHPEPLNDSLRDFGIDLATWSDQCIP